jgi:Mn-dependent DtxR family transcriptional regulator
MARTDLPRGHKLSMAGEDYLESIYRIALEGAGEDGSLGSVRSVDVAEQLGVSKASVSKALSNLRDAGMIEQSRYGRVALTPVGSEYARRVWRSHRAIRAFLTADLGVDPAIADEEACLMEHYLSEETIDRWCDYLEREGRDIK